MFKELRQLVQFVNQHGLIGRLVLQRHRVLDAIKLLARSLLRPVVDCLFERLSRHHDIDQGTAKSVGRFFQTCQRDSAG